MSSEAHNILETAPLGKLMRKYAFPCVVSMLVAALYNIVDQIFIANASYLGSYGNAANTVVFPMTLVAISIAVMIGDGCCTLVSISLGSRKRADAAAAVGNAVVSVVFVSLVLTFVYLAFRDQILSMFGARVNEETFRMSREYFFWITLGMPFYMFGQALNPAIRSDGSPRYAMITLLAGAVFNIIFDPICIFTLRWGMMGAAVATVGGQVLSAVLAAVYLRKMKATPLDKSCFVIQPSLVKKTLTLGFASFISQFSIVFCMGATIIMAVRYGAADPVFGQAEYSQIPTAIAGIVSKFFQIVISICVGIAAGCIPISGYNLGARRYDRVIGLMKRLMAVEAAIGLVFSLVFVLVPDQLMLMFGSRNESVYYSQFASWFIRGQLCLLPLACVNKASFIFLQSVEKPKESSVLSLAREFVFGVGFTLLLPMIWGLYALPFFMPVTDVLTFVGAAYVLSRVKKELEAPHAAAPREEAFMPSAELAGTGTVITIGRSYGAGGRSVGKRVAELLNIPYYDGALLEEAAKRSGLSGKYLAGRDEKPVPAGRLYQYASFNFDHDSSFVSLANRAQQEVIELVVSRGPCVIVGRRADQVLSGRQNLLSVFITASRESRVRRIMARDSLLEGESAAKLERVDKERAIYYNQYSQKRWGSADSYDLCIDTDRLGMEGSVSTILAAARAMDAKA